MKAIMTVGIGGSGKSTWTKEFCRSKDEPWVEVNRDHIRFQSILDLPGEQKDWSRWNWKKEKEVTQRADNLLSFAADRKWNVVVSDTNLNPKYRNEMIQKLESFGYEVEIKEFPITLEEAWKRDANRQGGVGHHVIYKQYLQWLEYKGRKKYEPNPNLLTCVVVDIDGTMAKMIDRGPFDWSKVGTDIVRGFIRDIVSNAAVVDEHHIVFLSGRDSVCKGETLEWLAKYSGLTHMQDFTLYMREEKDMRKDSIIKEELFWEYVAPEYNVVAVIDDRPVMVRTWYELGIENVISVGNPWIEF